MRKKLKDSIMIITVISMLITGCGSKQSNNTSSSKDTEATSSEESTTSKVIVDKEFSAKDLEVGYEDSTATHITFNFNENTADVSGDGAKWKDGVLTITNKGTYVFSGTLNDGQIVVDAEKTDKIQIVLNNVSLTCLDSAPIYIKNADKTFITLVENTKNTLIDGTNYTQSDDTNVDGVIFSKADLTLNGDGELNITGNYKHGIASKDDLVITSGTYNITAVKDALNGKDCVKVKDGTITLNTSTGNGIQSKNGDDETKGYVYIAGGSINITNSEEGIEGTVILVEGGKLDVTSKDDGFNAASGSNDTSNTSQDDISNVPQNNTSNTSQDDISNVPQNNTSNTSQDDISNVLQNDTSNTQQNDDTTYNSIANNTTNNTTINSSTATKLSTTDSNSSDQNQTGQWKHPGNGDFGGGGGSPFEVDTNCLISITGGTININAEGDGIDSNGSVEISGGTTYVNGPTSDGNAGLDYNGTANVTGGTIVVVGSSGMAQGFSDTSTQYSILDNLSTALEADTEIKLTDKDGNAVLTFTPSKQYQSVVISTPDLKKDQTYTITCGKQTNEITLSSLVTSIGEQGIGGKGGMREKFGQGMPDRGNDNQGLPPSQGDSPMDGAQNSDTEENNN